MAQSLGGGQLPANASSGVNKARFMLNGAREEAETRMNTMHDKLMPPYTLEDLTYEDLGFEGLQG